MRYLAISKGNAQTEAFDPSQADTEQMGEYVAAAMQAGWLVATEGLKPSAKASRIKVAAGERSIVDGPFTETKELIASYAIIQVGSKEEAIERCCQFLDLVGGGEIELWQLYEPTDFQ